MKIKITENTKNAFFMSEMNWITETGKSLKECGGISKEDLQMFANFVTGVNASEVFKSEAEFSKNARIFERYGEGTGHADVWVTITVYDGWKTFYIAGAYLSDIWEIGGVEHEAIKERMFIQKFSRED